VTGGLQRADLFILGGFFAVMLFVGTYYRGRVRSMTQFFAGGKRVPWWLGGISFYMVSFSALAFVMYSELVYKYGVVGFVLGWLSVPAAWLSARWFARRWRRVTETSPLEYIEVRYGLAARQTLAWLGLPTRMLDDSLKLFAIGTVVSAGMGISFHWAVVLCAGIILGYTFMGGLWAALVADFVQFAVLLGAVLVLPLLAFGQAGGVSHVFQVLPAEFWRVTRPEAGYSATYLVSYFVLLFLNYSTSWALVQRYYSSESDRQARKVGYLVAVLYLFGTAIFYAPAIAARVLLPDLANTKEVYVWLCRTVLPVGVLGMVVAAMFSATMSTLAGDYNAVSSVLTNDVHRRLWPHGATEADWVQVGRLYTVGVGLVVLGLTLLMHTFQGSRDLFDTMMKVFGLFLPPVAVPMLLGMLSPRFSSTGAQWALWGGAACGLLAFGCRRWMPGLARADVLTFLTTSAAVVLLELGSRRWPDPEHRRRQIQTFFEQLHRADEPVGRQGADYSFLTVVGNVLIALGGTLVGAIVFTRQWNAGYLTIWIGGVFVVAGGILRRIGPGTRATGAEQSGRPE